MRGKHSGDVYLIVQGTEDSDKYNVFSSHISHIKSVKVSFNFYNVVIAVLTEIEISLLHKTVFSLIQGVLKI